MIVEFSGEAESDLEQIADYIANDNQKQHLKCHRKTIKELGCWC